MSNIYVINHITLDGVMQSPGRPEEDTRDGFAEGGWSTPGVDDVLMTTTNSRVAQAGGLRLLLGRRSYEGMLAYWKTQDSPFKDGLNSAAKYIVLTGWQPASVPVAVVGCRASRERCRSRRR
jgi:dihydrofolate reductase